ncbi:MAG: AsmA family protein [Epsilonproteobacteria bacterium]|nr:AsmA family protein [Campylobacterota bacterium]
MGKKFLIGLVLVMTTIIVVLVALIMSFDLNKYKPVIEKKVYEATGKELKINGKIGLSLSPFGISINDIVVKNPKGFSQNNMFEMKKAAVSLELKPLLNKQVKVKYVKLIDINLLVEKNKKGILNLSVTKKDNKTKKIEKEAKPNKEKVKLPQVNVNKVLVENVNIIYDDRQGGVKAKIDGLNLSVNDISFKDNKDILKAIALKGLLTINDIKYDRYVLKDISANFKFKDKIATIDPMKLTTFGSQAVGKLIYNMQKKEPRIYIQEHIAKFDLKEISKEFIKYKNISLEGFVKTDMKLSMVGTNPKLIKRTLSGSVYVDGKDFGIRGVDLNQILQSYDKIKKVNKKNIGSFLLDAASSKGGVISGIGEGKTTAVKRLVIDAPIKRGVAVLKDVALSTGKYRIAVKGKLDLYGEKFLGVTVAFLDKKGCAKISQKIQGTFFKPIIKLDTSTLTSGVVQGAVKSLLGSFGNMIPGATSATKKKTTKCKVFYNGVVK